MGDTRIGQCPGNTPWIIVVVFRGRNFGGSNGDFDDDGWRWAMMDTLLVTVNVVFIALVLLSRE